MNQKTALRNDKQQQEKRSDAEFGCTNGCTARDCDRLSTVDAGQPQRDPDLIRLAEAWPRLPTPIRNAMLALLAVALSSD